MSSKRSHNKGEGPKLLIAGTVCSTAREPDDCDGDCNTASPRLDQRRAAAGYALTERQRAAWRLATTLSVGYGSPAETGRTLTAAATLRQPLSRKQCSTSQSGMNRPSAQHRE
jgi:hypothetical protein